jgi:hypothetical protein
LLTQIEVAKSAIWVSQMRKLAGSKAQIDCYQKRKVFQKAPFGIGGTVNTLRVLQKLVGISKFKQEHYR